MLLSVRIVVIGLVLMSAMLLAPGSYAEGRPGSQRIVSTDGATTEVLLALGMQDSLVAVDVTSVLPKAQADLPSVGYHRTLSAEGVMSMDPDLVVGSEHMGPPPVIAQLEAAGVGVVRQPPAHSIEGLKANIEQLAASLADGADSSALLAKIDEQQQKLQQQSLKGMRAIFLLTAENRLRLSGRGTAGDALIQLTGASNPADFDNYRSVTAETLLSYEPELIIVAGEGESDTAEALLNAQPMLSHTPAAQNQRIIAVDGRTLVAGIGPGAVREALRVVELLQAR
ncbi:heme/hemin ABC transporter substrate-binding protein [Marinobacterium lutimaris]|uniref:Iron complex transport system substrate-binding protein n=1 Tax=Marinobacterium lutimaris TaxID=568106 RepID=A0A1H6CAA0_9GAMM|nr:ABC transporter substrate-binding protein [Marinobacterium lutimaris]SEG69838.1 iron complex transport system substrate-binding protein [Marinobacterium lutimaris]